MVQNTQGRSRRKKLLVLISQKILYCDRPGIKQARHSIKICKIIIIYLFKYYKISEARKIKKDGSFCTLCVRYENKCGLLF